MKTRPEVREYYYKLLYPKNWKEVLYGNRYSQASDTNPTQSITISSQNPFASGTGESMSQWISSTSALPKRHTDCDVIYLSRAIFLEDDGDETAWLCDKSQEKVLYWRSHEEDNELDKEVILKAIKKID